MQNIRCFYTILTSSGTNCIKDFFFLLDDCKEAYSTLRQLIKEYLGLEDQEKEGGWSTRVTPQNTTTGKTQSVQLVFAFIFAIYFLQWIWGLRMGIESEPYGNDLKPCVP